MPVLSLWAPLGGVLSITAPLALAQAAGTALVVDLDPNGPSYPSAQSLADLASVGPRRADLSPQRAGVAVLANGGIEESSCLDLLGAFDRGWPAVVLRVAPGRPRPARAGVVPVVPLLPGPLRPGIVEPAVRQRCGWMVRADGPGPVLPRPGAATVRALLEGRRPGPSRWIRAWRQVWGHPWL